MQGMNNTFLSLDLCNEENKVLSDGIDSCKAYFTISEHSQQDLKEQVRIYKEEVSEKDKLIVTTIKTLKDQEKRMKKLEFKKSLLATSTGILIVVCTFLIIL